MAEGSREGGSNSNKDWVVPVARGVDLKNEKPWALQALYDLYGWVINKRADGKFDVVEEVVGVKKDEPQE